MRIARLLVLPLVLTVAACGSEASSSGGGGGGGAASAAKPTLDQSSPRALALSIFAIAKDGDLALLAPVADPLDADGDSKDVAGVAKAPAERQAEFRTYFAKGTVSGEPKVEGDVAEVPILFGPDGKKTETLKMVKRDGRWYLQSF